MIASPTRHARTGRRLSWQQESQLAVLRLVIRLERRIHGTLLWILPLRGFLLWSSILTGIAGLAAGMVLKLALHL